MKLRRPYIPLSVRVAVAERQYFETRGGRVVMYFRDGVKLKLLLKELFGEQKVELHHRPALCNRRQIRCIADDAFIRYDPDANDPEFLYYVTKEDHHVETRVRGLHGQHSDLAFLRKSKRVLRKRQQKKRCEAYNKRVPKNTEGIWGKPYPKAFCKHGVNLTFRCLACNPKRKWPKRKFPKRRKK